MNWKRVDRYAERTEDGEYSVCAHEFVDGRRGYFQAWRTQAHPLGRYCIATRVPTAEQARQLCLEDAQQ